MTRTKEERKHAARSPVPISTDEARGQLGELANRAGYGGERFVLTRHGKPVAAMVSLSDLAKLEAAAA